MILPTVGKNLSYLEECLLSIEKQTLQNFKLLLLIDGNAEVLDDVITLVKRCISRPSRVLLSSKRRGVSRSLNLLCRLANTQYLARMDDDDRCHPKRLELSLSSIIECGADVLGTGANIINASGYKTDVAYGIDFTKEPNINDYIFGPVFFHPSVIYRRDWILQNRYDRSWKNGQDRELWLRTRGAKFVNLNEPLIDYRVRPPSASVYLKALYNKKELIIRVRSTLGRRDYYKLLISFFVEASKVYFRKYTMWWIK